MATGSKWVLKSGQHFESPGKKIDSSIVRDHCSEYVRIKFHPLDRYSDPGEGATETRSIANYIIIE